MNLEHQDRPLNTHGDAVTPHKILLFPCYLTSHSRKDTHHKHPNRRTEPLPPQLADERLTDPTATRAPPGQPATVAPPHFPPMASHVSRPTPTQTQTLPHTTPEANPLTSHHPLSALLQMSASSSEASCRFLPPLLGAAAVPASQPQSVPVDHLP